MQNDFITLCRKFLFLTEYTKHPIINIIFKNILYIQVVIIMVVNNIYVFDKENMALRGLKITWVCIAILFISCSIILQFKIKNSTFLLFPKLENTFPFVSTSWRTGDIGKKTSKTIRGTGTGYIISVSYFFRVSPTSTTL